MRRWMSALVALVVGVSGYAMAGAPKALAAAVPQKLHFAYGPIHVRITYDIPFIPAQNAKPLTPVIPIWMDVQNGSVYPVFDVHRGSGTNGKFTYPDPAHNPYPGRRKNTFKMSVGGTLVAAGGHL